MKHEYITKLSAFLSNLPIEKRREEIANCLKDAYGLITKKAAETDVSLPSKLISLKKLLLISIEEVEPRFQRRERFGCIWPRRILYASERWKQEESWRIGQQIIFLNTPQFQRWIQWGFIWRYQRQQRFRAAAIESFKKERPCFHGNNMMNQ